MISSFIPLPPALQTAGAQMSRTLISETNIAIEKHTETDLKFGLALEVGRTCPRPVPSDWLERIEVGKLDAEASEIDPSIAECFQVKVIHLLSNVKVTHLLYYTQTRKKFIARARNLKTYLFVRTVVWSDSA